MKSIHLNLASRPHRDYRPVYAAAAIGGALTLILMLYNLQTAYRYLVETRETRTEIAAIEQKVAGERERARELETTIAKVDIRTIGGQTEFINTQIEERAFSWSQLIDSLEDVVPEDVRLLNLNPTFDKEGVVQLNLSCAARDPDGMLDLLEQLLHDPRFGKAFPQSHRADGDGRYSFNVTVQYFPAVAAGGRS